MIEPLKQNLSSESGVKMSFKTVSNLKTSSSKTGSPVVCAQNAGSNKMIEHMINKVTNKKPKLSVVKKMTLELDQTPQKNLSSTKAAS
jgi:hypothetical protein